MNFPAFVENVLATRLKQIDIAGFRGVRACISIPLNGSSLLLYGDNGSGKSSITDAFEWFYHDRVGHLSTEGIGKKGISALRNIHLPDEKDGQVDLTFSDGTLSSTKTLTSRHDKLSSKHSNESEGFVDYLDQSQKENLILRYRDLLEFILHKKAQNLQEISHIIGFEEVAKTKSVIKKAVNDLKKEQKIQNCESRASAKQAIIIAQIGQNVVSREQYLDAVRTLVAPLKLALAITDETSIEQVLESIKGSGNDQDVLLQASYEKAEQGLRGLVDAIKDIIPRYAALRKRRQELLTDLDKVKKISMSGLLSEALTILTKGVFAEEACPVCLQPTQRADLIRDLQRRCGELETFQKERMNCSRTWNPFDTLFRRQQFSPATLKKNAVYP